ncbi:MAG: hypothetical protein QOG44_3430 [Acidimicrobiaceae bacterium]|jgi:hypothetical protein|nr:hypothetical protein [Acidimicrobiaceae bacterium]
MPVEDDAAKPLAAVYLDIYDRSLRKASDHQRTVRCLYLLLAVAFLALGIANLIEAGMGSLGLVYFPLALVWLADFVFLPRIAAQRQSRLDASRATLLRQ